MKRLNETKEEERQRIVESKLAEERRGAAAKRGRVPHGPAGRGGRGGARSNSSARPTGTGDANLICAWCQVMGHKIGKCRTLEKDYAEGRAIYDSNILRYVRIDHQLFTNPPPSAQTRGGGN